MYKFITAKEVNNLFRLQTKRQKEGVSNWLNPLLRSPLIDRSLALNHKVVTFMDLPEEDWLKYMEEGFCPAIEYLSDWVLWPHNTGVRMFCEIRYVDGSPTASTEKREISFI